MTALALAPADLDRGDLARWGGAFAVVVGLHAVVLVGIVSARLTPNASGEALPAVMIDMPPPAAPQVAPADMPPSAPIPEAAMPEPVVDAPPDVPEPEVAPPQPVMLAELPPLEPLPDVPPDPNLKPPPPEPEAATVALPPPVPRTAPPPLKVAETKPVTKPPKPVQAKRGERRDERRPPSPEAGAQTTSSIPSQSSGAAAAAAKASWQGALVAALNRAKRAQSETGLASVRFSIDRGGRVLSAGLAGSAGSAALDGEAVALVRRADLPGAPSDVPGSTFTFTVPIRFTSR